MKNFLLSLLCLYSASTLSATETNDAYLDSIFEIKEVSVIGLKDKEVIKPQVLKAADLERMSSHSVADALRYFSGVQIKDYGGIGGVKTVNIRSMGSNHVGVFYNGVQLGNMQNGQVDLGRYSLDNVDAISLYNGQKSDIFQTAKDFSTASAIYISTKRPRFASNEHTHLKVQMRTGSFGLANPSILWEQKLSHTIHLSVNAEYTYANGKYDFRYKRMASDGSVAYDTTATRQNGDVQAFRGEFGLYGYVPEGKWNINGYFYTSERGIPGAIVNNVFRRGERQWDKAAFGQGTFAKKITDFYEFKVNGKFSWDYMRFLRNDPKELYLDNSYYQREAYLSFANLFKITDWWNASFAADCQLNNLTSHVPLMTDPTDPTKPTRWMQYLSFATAFNFDHWRVQASVLGNFVEERATKEEYVFKNRYNKFAPAVFITYQPWSNGDLRITGFYKRIFRMPSFNELYYTETGNVADVKPEFATQYDLGLAYKKQFDNGFFDYIDFRADGYYNNVSNKIITYPAGQFRWKVINLGKVEILGAEISTTIGAHIGNVNLRGLAEYTYQHAVDKSDPEDSFYNQQIPYIPHHSTSLSCGATWRGWDFNYCFIYTGKRYNAREHLRENFEPPWYTHDMSLSKNFMLRKLAFKVTGELNNIFNQAYEVIHNYPMPGRNFRIALKMEI